MLKLPFVTFVVTSFNYEKYILKTLESIKAQTYKDFEIIVVDDCSSDNSVEVVEQFINDNQDLRITLLKNDSNQGQLFSMLRGLKEAQGQFVSFIDSDDMLFEDYAETHIRVHLQTSVAFTSCQITEIGEDDEVHSFKSNASPQLKKDDMFQTVLAEVKSGAEIKYNILKNKSFGGWYWSPNSSAMFRKAAIEFLLSYKNMDKWKICPDKFLFNIAHLIGGSALIYEPLVAYRRHKTNAGKSFGVIGDKRLHTDYITKININNNLKIRPEALMFFLTVRKKLGLRNTFTYIVKILASLLGL